MSSTEQEQVPQEVLDAFAKTVDLGKKYAEYDPSSIERVKATLAEIQEEDLVYFLLGTSAASLRPIQQAFDEGVMSGLKQAADALGGSLIVLDGEDAEGGGFGELIAGLVPKPPTDEPELEPGDKAEFPENFE